MIMKKYGRPKAPCPICKAKSPIIYENETSYFIKCMATAHLHIKHKGHVPHKQSSEKEKYGLVFMMNKEDVKIVG